MIYILLKKKSSVLHCMFSINYKQTGESQNFSLFVLICIKNKTLFMPSKLDQIPDILKSYVYVYNFNKTQHFIRHYFHWLLKRSAVSFFTKQINENTNI